MAGRAREAAGALEADRIEVVAGDIGDRRLGLADDPYARLLAEVVRVYHLAAIYDLARLRIAPMRAALADTPPESIAYLNHSVAFDVRRAEALLAPHGLRPPRFGDYVDAMVRFFRAHEDDPAFWPNA